MITDREGHLRLPSVREKEILMGFDKGYVSNSFGPKASVAERNLTGGQMIGNTFCVHVIVVLLHSLLQRYGFQQPRYTRQLVSAIGEAPGAWVDYPKFHPKAAETLGVTQLVSHIMRHAERGGTDVRLDLQTPFRIKAWPRSGFQSSMFEWAIIHGYGWRAEAHINCLELQAVLNAVKWRLRKAARCNQRILHLVDSQVVAAILAKGRSSSFRLQLTLSKYAALWDTWTPEITPLTSPADGSTSPALSTPAQTPALQANSEGAHGLSRHVGAIS